MANDLTKIYETFGSNICLFPYMTAFYSQKIPQYVAPCSVIDWTENWKYINDDILQSVNQPNWIELRKNFRSGSCHTSKVCQTCSIAEDNHGVSPRVSNNKYFVEHINTDIITYLQKIIDNNYIVDTILSLDYEPSNYCNFECVMCSGEVSSSRNAFEIKVYGKKNRNIPTFINDKNFYFILNTVEILNFCGGETLLQTRVHELIDYLIENNLAKNLTISILTNVSKYPEKLAEKFKQFKNVFYTLSIDGIGKVIEYQRRGCNWEETEKIAVRLWKDYGSVINYVITAINVFSFIETIEWFSKHNMDKVILTLVFDANKDISIKVIPPELKLNLIDKLKNHRNICQKQHFSNLIDQMISILENVQYDPTLLDEFKLTISIEDSASKHRLIDVVPEWTSYFK